MKKSKFVKFVKNHKWQTGVCVGVLILLIGIGGFTYSSQMQKEANTQKALEILGQKGEISTDKLQELNDNGGMVDFGEEIVDPNTGETVVLTVNENGTVQRTVVRDSSGNDTGAVVPVNHSEEYTGGSSSSGESGGSSSGGSSDGDSPAGHSHNWVAHYDTRTVQTGTQYVVDVPAQAAVTEQVLVHGPGYQCNACGAYLADWSAIDAHITSHGHGGHHSCGPEYKTVVVSPATAEQGHYEPVYGTEQYIDYYYCSDCGTHQ